MARPARREDLEFAFAALRDAMGEYVAAAFGAWDDALQYELFERSFDLHTHRVLQSCGDDVGILAVEWHVDRVQLARIFLLPGAQGHGRGGRVVRALLDAARAKALPVVLTVLRTNPRAQAFYERLGFRGVGETSTHWLMEAE